jgi:hypothetical protein
MGYIAEWDFEIFGGLRKMEVWRLEESCHRVELPRSAIQEGSYTQHSTRVNQHPPVYHEVCMDGKWSETIFLSGFISLANHGV